MNMDNKNEVRDREEKTNDRDKKAELRSPSPEIESRKVETDGQQTRKRYRDWKENFAHPEKQRRESFGEDDDSQESSITRTMLEKEEKEESEASKRLEVTQLSDSVFIYHNKRMSDHGNVFEGEIRGGVYGVRVCVIKFARKSEQNVRESRILTKLSSHTHVVSIIQSDIYEYMFDERVYIAMEKCHKQNLHQHITHQNESGLEFNLNEALKYSKQIIAGVTYIHEKLIIHKDLKPSNILLTHDKSTIKLADFGLSQEIKSTSSKVYCKHQFGTNGFRPIESFGNDWVSLKSDNFSLGVIFYFVLSNGKSPFGDEISLWIHNTQNGVIDLSHLLVPNANTFQHLIKLMLSKERCRRPSISQIGEHPCWKEKEAECNFDYGCEEEVEDSDSEISKLITPDSEDFEMDIENRRIFFKALQKMGYKLPAAARSSIVVFTSRPMRLQRFSPGTKSVIGMHEFSDEMKGNIYNFSTVCLDKFIYILTRSSLYRIKYTDRNAVWERKAGLIADHGDRPPAVAAFGAIFVSGSCNGTETKSVSKYDPSHDRWEKLEQKQLATSWAAIISLNQYIYSIGGGAEGVGITNRVERLNVDSQTWDEVTPMRDVRYGPGVTECGGNILAAGGMDPKYLVHNSVEKYNPNVDQWTILKPMMERRRWFRCHVINGYVYAVFGSQAKKSIEKYDAEKDEWEIVDFLKLELSSTESVLIQLKQ